MSTPQDKAKKEANSRIDSFEKELRKLPGGLGAGLTRSERALLLTFSLWESAQERTEVEQ